MLERLQQVREHAGLAPLRIDPMLAYQANLDALLTEHMATHRILATHVTDAGQMASGNTAWLNDLCTTQVGIGISLTEHGDSGILSETRKKLLELAGTDKELLFAARRRIMVQLAHDERSKPAQRKKLKALKMREQDGLCPLCTKALPEKYAELDRYNASAGYTAENTRLVHHECHIADQKRKQYS